MQQPVLRAEQVSFRYKGRAKPACDRISLTLNPGEMVALLGPNGAGKSTLLSLLTGRRKPTEGRIELMGGSPTDPKVRRHLGVTPQETAFPKTVRVREVLSFVLAQYGANLDPKLLQATNTERLWDRLVGGLSGGERRRVGLACALCAKPDLIVLDEPTGGLDIESRADFFAYLKHLVRNEGRTVLFSSHYVPEVELLADRVAVLNQGRKIREGRLEEMRHDVGHKRIRFRARAELNIPETWPSEFRDGVYELVAKEPEQFLKWLVKSEAEFTALEVQPASLEEIFVRMVQ